VARTRRKTEQKSKGPAADGWPIEAWFPPGGDFDVVQKQCLRITASVCIRVAQGEKQVPPCSLRSRVGMTTFEGMHQSEAGGPPFWFS
jgi:hypothetical protein